MRAEPSGSPGWGAAHQRYLLGCMIRANVLRDLDEYVQPPCDRDRLWLGLLSEGRPQPPVRTPQAKLYRFGRATLSRRTLEREAVWVKGSPEWRQYHIEYNRLYRAKRKAERLAEKALNPPPPKPPRKVQDRNTPEAKAYQRAYQAKYRAARAGIPKQAAVPEPRDE